MKTYKDSPCSGCGSSPYKPAIEFDIKPSVPFTQGIDVGFPKPRFLPNGDIEYPKRGWEPPPDIEGYTRDKANAWLFHYSWVDCDTRQKQTVRMRCGAVNVKMICKCPDCPLFHTDVKAENCAKCEHRKAPE